MLTAVHVPPVAILINWTDFPSTIRSEVFSSTAYVRNSMPINWNGFFTFMEASFIESIQDYLTVLDSPIF